MHRREGHPKGTLYPTWTNNWKLRRIRKELVREIFSVELMKDIVGFCKTTKNDVTEQIKTKEAHLQNKSSQEKYTSISNAIKENQKLRVRRLTYQKNKKFNRLKYPDNQRPTFERQGRTPASNNQKGNRRSRSKSQNRKHHFNNNQQHNSTNQ